MFKQILMASIALAASAPMASAQTPGPAQEAPLVKADCAPPALVNSVAMTKLPGSDVMSIDAVVEGAPKKLVIDTGSQDTRLWQTTAAKLHLTVLDRGQYFMDSGGRFSEGAARIEDFSFGAMKTGGFHALITPPPDANAAPSPYDGVIGMDIMWRYDVDLDFAHGKVNFFQPEDCKGGGIYWSPGTITAVPLVSYFDTGYVRYIPRFNANYIPVVLDGHMIIALLDTASDRTYLNPEVADKEFGLHPESMDQAIVTDGGTAIKAGVHKFAGLSFGGLAAANPVIAIPLDIQSQNTGIAHASKVARDHFALHEIMPDMVIGMDILKHSHLYFSFRDARVYVAAANEGAPLAAPALKPAWFNVWRR